MCRFFGVPEDSLPEVIASADVYGSIGDRNCLLNGVTLGGILGDQQAALVGQTWNEKEQEGNEETSKRPNIKVTYGTGAFLLWNIGEKPVFSSRGLLTTLAYQMRPKEKPHFAIEVRLVSCKTIVVHLAVNLAHYTFFSTFY